MKFDKVVNFFLWLILITIAGVYIYTLVATKGRAVQPYLVQSGSMEPTIMTGDIIFVNPQPKYIKNDVVTFLDNQGRTVTHRIIQIQGSTIQTKGDANQAKDTDTIEESQVVGKVVFTLPKAGYLVAFAKTPVGFTLFIVLPTVLLLFSEVRAFFFTSNTKKTRTKSTSSIL